MRLSEVIGYFVAGVATLAGTIGVFHYRNKYKAIRKALGKTITELAEKGGDDGLLAIDIHDQDIDFKFLPTLQREKGFYYIERNGEKRHIKIGTKDIHFLRGKFPAVFLVNDKIRAADIDILKKINLLDPVKRSELLADWSRYSSLKNALNEIEEELRFAGDEQKRRELISLMEGIRKEMSELEKKWHGVFVELDAEKALAFYDPEENKVHIIQVLNFRELADFMTGVHDDEIEETVRRRLNRKLEGILKDITEKLGAFRIPGEEQQVDQGSRAVGILVGILIMLAIGAILIKAMAGG